MKFAPTLAGFLAVAALVPATVFGAGSLSQQEQQWQLAGGQAVKIDVTRDGWYHVSRQKLLAAGLPATAAAKTLRLFADGREVAIRVVRNGSIEFFGVRRTSVDTDTRTYWLVWGGDPGKRLSRAKTTSGGRLAQVFTSQVVSRPRSVYYAYLKGGPGDNFFGPLVRPGTPVTRTISVPSVARGGRPALDVGLQGVSLKPHEASVAVNGTKVGSVTFNDQGAAHVLATLPAGLLNSGDNNVTVTADASSLDFFFLWKIQLTYARTFQAQGDRLAFQLARGRRAQVTGFTTPHVQVFDVTDPYSPRLVRASVRKSGTTYTLRVPRSSRLRRLFAVGSDAVLAPASVTSEQPSHWHATDQGADMVIISYKDFIPALAPLVQLRQSQGLNVKVIDVQDLYDEFTFGVPDPSAIHDFLARAYENWNPRPRYVLLVGDASYDPHGYLNPGVTDFVPSISVEAGGTIVPSDNELADFNNDGIPELAVGRLPVDTLAEADTVVGKIVSYDTQPPPAGRGALFVVDHDPDIDLEGSADSLMTLLPDSMPLQRIYRRDSQDDGSFRTTLRAALNTGPDIVDYVGHGGPEVWSRSYLDYIQAGQLQNGANLSLYVMTSCLNAWFLEPKSESLAEALLKAPNGGAIATVSSSGLETVSDGAKVNGGLLQALFAGGSPTIGEAFQAATRSAGGGELTKVSLLFGDPASRLR